eukprot:15452507-Alexandrium_andersonii.AAC.1
MAPWSSAGASRQPNCRWASSRADLAATWLASQEASNSAFCCGVLPDTTFLLHTREFSSRSDIPGAAVTQWRMMLFIPSISCVSVGSIFTSADMAWKSGGPILPLATVAASSTVNRRASFHSGLHVKASG